MSIKGVHHVSLKAQGAEEFQQVLDFYQQVLDCPLIRHWGQGDSQGAMLDLGNTILEVTSNGMERCKGLFAHLAFATDDVDGMVERLRAAGCPCWSSRWIKIWVGTTPSASLFVPVPLGKSWNFSRN